jgi:hypothetical protein
MPRTAPSLNVNSYWSRSQRPLQALIFLLPLIVVYEVGMAIYADASQPARHIFARSLLRDFFEIFGATGYYLPGLIVVVVLLAMHFARGDPFRLEPRLYWLMATESAAAALPLFVFMLVLFRQPAPAAVTLGSLLDNSTWQEAMLSAIGAGIYEELLFRLIGIALLHMLFVDVLSLPHRWGAMLSIGLSAVAFALYHFSDPKTNPFDWGKCLFYVAAGVYLAGVYVVRGFGIVAGTHAIYDVLVGILHLLAARQQH